MSARNNSLLADRMRSLAAGDSDLSARDCSQDHTEVYSVKREYIDAYNSPTLQVSSDILTFFLLLFLFRALSDSHWLLDRFVC